MDSPILRGEHEAFANEIRSEFRRINARLKEYETGIKEITKLTMAVERLATNMEHTLKEVTNQGQRLEKLEDRDGEMWRKVMTYVITAVVGLAIGAIGAIGRVIH